MPSIAIIAHVALAEAVISGSDVCAMKLAPDERRFEIDCTPHLVEHLVDNGSCYTAKDTATSPSFRTLSLLHARPITGKQRHKRGVREYL